MKLSQRLPAYFVLIFGFAKGLSVLNEYRKELVARSYLLGRRSIFDEEYSTEDHPSYLHHWFSEAETGMTALAHSILTSEEPCFKPEYVEHYTLNSCRALISAVDQCREYVLDEIGKPKRRLTDNPFG